jgi:putative Holliday junction resolvase
MTLPQPQSPEPPRRLLALDAGQSRTGVAISDELGMFSHSRPAIISKDPSEVVNAVARLIDEEAISEVVVGLPLTLAGDESDQTRTTRDFVRRLRQALAIPVTEWDERLSSREAAQTVKGAARRKAGDLDSAAASVILQAVLDSRRERTRP